MRSLAAYPHISIVIPTLNSEKTLRDCLESILGQDYPADRLEVIVADGGSTDSTRAIVRLAESKGPFRLRVVANALKTGEAGKAAGARRAEGEIIAFVDSDNILPDQGWLGRMVEPFRDPEITAAEPLEYTCRATDGYITRYCAYMGMNDPLCLFLGNYDRYSSLTGRWTEMPYKAEDSGPYFKLELDPKRFPTIGANGFMIRKDELDGVFSGDYLFDVDLVYELLNSGRKVRFAKVKTGIIHVFSGDVRTFARKQRRRIADFNHYSRLGLRKYPWRRGSGVARFVLSCVTVLPLLAQTAKGYAKRPGSAWLFHPVACWLTLIVYSAGAASGCLRPRELKREGWSQ